MLVVRPHYDWVSFSKTIKIGECSSLKYFPVLSRSVKGKLTEKDQMLSLTETLCKLSVSVRPLNRLSFAKGKYWSKDNQLTYLGSQVR